VISREKQPIRDTLQEYQKILAIYHWLVFMCVLFKKFVLLMQPIWPHNCIFGKPYILAQKFIEWSIECLSTVKILWRDATKDLADLLPSTNIFSRRVSRKYTDISISISVVIVMENCR